MKQKNTKKRFIIKSLVTTISMAMAGLASTAHASDIEIYTVPHKGQKTITIMLDTSGSMNYCDTPVTYSRTQVVNRSLVTNNHTIDNFYSVDYFNTGWNDNYSTDGGRTYTYPNQAEIRKYVGKEMSTTTPSYERAFCYIQENGRPSNKKSYDRITKLKDAVFALMDSGELDDTLHVSVGQFYTVDGKRGVIEVPSAPLTPAHRLRIKRYVAGLYGSNATPIASSYAETAAYMMGTNTVAQPIRNTTTNQRWVLAKDHNGQDRYYYCGRRGSGASTLNDSLELLNIDETGACTGIYGSTLSMTPDEATRQGYKVQACRGLKGRGWVYTNQGDIQTNCLYKDNEVTTTTIDASDSESGFPHSKADTKNAAGTNYKSPLPATGLECSGQSIYFFTDGIPNGATNPQLLMRQALGDKAGDFPTNVADFSDTSKYLPSTANQGMAQAGELAKRLRDKDRNPKGVSIRTALVGFGSDFAAAKSAKVSLVDDKGKPFDYYDCEKITNNNIIKTMCNFGAKSHPQLPKVGGYGEGGFYYAEETQDVINSFLAVANDIDIKFEPIATGSPTIPTSSLNLQNILQDAYYASFTPKPETPQQLWTGNVNKYKTRNNTLYGQADKPLFRNGNLDADTVGFWDGGVVGQLPLQQNDKKEFKRTIYTNRANNASSTTLNKVDVTALGSGVLAGDTAKNHWLNLLGYNIAKDASVDFTNLPSAELRQTGSIMHSNPILLTQSGTINRQLQEVREDYLLYGSTQGLLHVIDNATGQEKFAFVPNEMVENQRDAFLSEGSTDGGRDNLFYGIDAPWVSHTEYVTKPDGTLTVGASDDSGRVKGKQWVYGGLRMGGRSYYSLDLGNINAPELKFHIDPATKTVHSAKITGGSKVYPELQHMGQSWSKPALGYVRWEGRRRHVMFVGGGYDKGYETSDYQQTNGLGAGVYMFDADTGELLWWASSNSVTDGVATKHSSGTDDTNSLRYSIVSRINAIDRDNNGLIDALYFGDLGGQGFRIDLNNSATTKESFSLRVVKLFDEHKADGTSPRFYEMPSVSVYDTEGRDGLVGAVAFGSGDRSSPLAGDFMDGDKPATKNTKTANDATFVSFDYDLGRPGWKSLSMDNMLTRYSKGSLKPADTTDGVKADKINQGWKFTYPAAKLGGQKSFDEPYTITNLLYVNVYNRDGGKKANDCGGGVIGESFAYRFCLPTGKCNETDHGYDEDVIKNKDYKSLGGVLTSYATPGLVGMTLGAGKDGAGTIGNISSKQANSSSNSTIGTEGVDCSKTPHALECSGYPLPPTLTSARWYESRQGD